MIGTMNIPTDSPKEYYASRRRFFTEPSQSSTETNESCSINKNNNNDKNNNNKNVGTQKTIPTIKLQRPTTSSIFCRRQKRAPKIGYLSDGRKLSNGQLVYPVSASSLWRQLIVRTFVHKMEDEIPDPVEQIAKLHDSFPKLSREKSISTYSLVSHNRIESQCDKCTPDMAMSKWQQIASLSKSSATLYGNDDDDVFDSSTSSSSCSTCSNESTPKTANKGNQYLSPNVTTYPARKTRFSLP